MMRKRESSPPPPPSKSPRRDAGGGCIRGLGMRSQTQVNLSPPSAAAEEMGRLRLCTHPELPSRTRASSLGASPVKWRPAITAWQPQQGQHDQGGQNIEQRPHVGQENQQQQQQHQQQEQVHQPHQLHQQHSAHSSAHSREQSTLNYNPLCISSHRPPAAWDISPSQPRPGQQYSEARPLLAKDALPSWPQPASPSQLQPWSSNTIPCARACYPVSQHTHILASSSGRVWEAFQRLIFPFRLLVLCTRALEDMTADGAAALLDGLPGTPPHQIEDCNWGQCRGSWQPAQIIRTMLDMQWISWTGTEYRYHYQAPHAIHSLPSPGPASASRLVSAVMSQCPGCAVYSMVYEPAQFKQDTSCYLTRHLVNDHDRVLAVRLRQKKCAGCQLKSVAPKTDTPSRTAREAMEEEPAQVPQTLVELGRLYKFFAHKEQKKDKDWLLYYYATESACGGDQLETEGTVRHDQGTREREATQPGSFVTLGMQSVHDLLGATRTISLPGKLSSRLALYLSPAHGMQIPSAKVYYRDDITSASSGACMTDGAGLVALDIAAACPNVNAGKVSLRKDWEPCCGPRHPVLQCRLHDPRCWPPLLSKGTLTPCAKLPPGSIVVTWSMVKAPEAPKDLVGSLFLLDPEMSLLLGAPIYTINSRLLQSVLHAGRQSLETFRSVHMPPGQALTAYSQIRSGPVAPLPTTTANEALRDIQGHTWAKCSSQQSEDPNHGAPNCRQLMAAHQAAGLVPTDAPWAQLQVNNNGFAKRVSSLNSNMILLLSSGGVPFDFFRSLMELQVEQLKLVGTDLEATKNAAGGGLSTDLHRLRCEQRKLRRKCKLPVPSQTSPDNGCYTLVGVPDVSRSIPQGCIVVVTDEAQWINKQVLMYRHPGLHPSDLRHAHIVPPPDKLVEWYWKAGCGVQNTIFFSTQGDVSLGQQLAGGDFDGDEFVIIDNPTLLKEYKDWEEPGAGVPTHCTSAQPFPTETPAASKSSVAAAAEVALPEDVSLTVRDQQSQADMALKTLFAPPKVDYCTVLHLLYTVETRATHTVAKNHSRWQDWAEHPGANARGPQALEVARCHTAALDAFKQGKIPECAGKAWCNGAYWKPACFRENEDAGPVRPLPRQTESPQTPTSIRNDSFQVITRLVGLLPPNPPKPWADADFVMDEQVRDLCEEMVRPEDKAEAQCLHKLWNDAWCLHFKATPSMDSSPSPSHTSKSNQQRQRDVEVEADLQRQRAGIKQVLLQQIMCRLGGSSLTSEETMKRRVLALYLYLYKKADGDKRSGTATEGRSLVNMVYMVAGQVLCEIKAKANHDNFGLTWYAPKSQLMEIRGSW